MKRIRFTHTELELISEMMSIASAQSLGEGDYQFWTDSTDRTFDSLQAKVAELKKRAVKAMESTI